MCKKPREETAHRQTMDRENQRTVTAHASSVRGVTTVIESYSRRESDLKSFRAAANAFGNRRREKAF